VDAPHPFESQGKRAQMIEKMLNNVNNSFRIAVFFAFDLAFTKQDFDKFAVKV